jgi:hypothetical protein
MQADNASTIDSLRKEKNGNDGLDATVRGPSPTGVVDIEDAVFGAIGEDGPNYRNVSRLVFHNWIRAHDPSIVGLDRRKYRHGESASRSRCALDPGDTAHTRYSARRDPHAGDLRHELLVGLGRW